MKFSVREILRWYLLPFAVLVMTVVAWMVARQMLANDARLEFEMSAAEVRNAVQSRMFDYMQSLEQTSGFMAGSHDVTREEFREYVRAIRVQEYFPGTQGVGLALHVTPDELRRFEKLGRKSGVADFHVWPEGLRSEYHSILYLEPLDKRNRAAIGYDMLFEATRRDAIERARDSGQPSISGKVRLVQEIDNGVQPGLLLYVPLYQKNVPLATVEQRRKAFLGTIYAPLRAQDLFDAVFSTKNQRVGFRIYASPVQDQDMLLYQVPADGVSAESAENEKAVQLKIVDQTWNIHFFSLPPLRPARYRFLPHAILLGGLLLVFLTLRIIAGNHRYLVVQKAALENERKLVNARDEVLAIVSHDLRNPLNSILLSAKMLIGRQGAPLVGPEQFSLIAENIFRAGGRMEQLIQDLLDVAQFESGAFRLDLKPINPASVIESCMELLLPQVNEKGVDLVFQVHQLQAVIADEKRFSQVIINLVANALKYTPKGGAIRLSVDHLPNQKQVHFVVTDSGKGIAKEDLPKIFQRFWLKDPRKQGTGLGLFIVEQIVKAHGGTIWVESEIGKGSSFHFTLEAAGPLSS